MSRRWALSRRIKGISSVPKVIIDNLSDPLATILEIEFGDKLGELVDTCEAIRNLGLDISRAEITEDNQNRFYVTDHQSSEKITADRKQIGGFETSRVDIYVLLSPRSARFCAANGEKL